MIRELVKRAYENSKAKGFWAAPNPGEKIALIHSEASEALEALRQIEQGNVGEELADICIRTFDLAGFLKIDLEKEILCKMAANEARPHMHGKRF